MWEDELESRTAKAGAWTTKYSTCRQRSWKGPPDEEDATRERNIPRGGRRQQQSFQAEQRSSCSVCSSGGGDDRQQYIAVGLEYDWLSPSNYQFDGVEKLGKRLRVSQVPQRHHPQRRRSRQIHAEGRWNRNGSWSTSYQSQEEAAADDTTWANLVWV